MNTGNGSNEAGQTVANWPQFDEEQISDVVAVLRSGKVNAWTGNKVREFEQAYAALLGRRHAIALANGTVALDVALHAIGLQPGDEVIVTPRSFVASASCVPMAGGVPVFADVDAESQAMTAESIAAVLTPRTRAVIVVHLAGWPADMDAIMRLARQSGIVVIEDCAQAHGAEFGGRPAGHFGDIAVFSFCQDKIITTGGEGGLLAMDDDAIWNRAWSFKDHGKVHGSANGKPGPVGFRWLIETFGSNYRMIEIEAAIGLRQLQRLPSWLAQRAANAAILMDAFRDLPGLRTPEPPAAYSPRLVSFLHVHPAGAIEAEAGTAIALWKRSMPLASRASPAAAPKYIGRRPSSMLVSSRAKRLPTAVMLGETSLAFLVDPCQDAASMRRVADRRRGRHAKCHKGTGAGG